MAQPVHIRISPSKRAMRIAGAIRTKLKPLLFVAVVCYGFIFPFQLAFQGPVCFNKQLDWAGMYTGLDAALLLDVLLQLVEGTSSRSSLAFDVVSRFPLFLCISVE